MPLTKELWDRNFNIALLCLETKFVQGIKHGDLPKKLFQDYIAQDFYFLESFRKAYQLALLKSNNPKSSKSLNILLQGVSEELILHKTYSKSWDVDLTKQTLSLSTKKYTDFLENISMKCNLIEILCAMTPCMRLYAWLGKSLEGNSQNNPYKEWIDTYSDDGFEQLAQSLEQLIDESEESFDISRADYLYMAAMKLELEFFSNYSYSN